MGTSTSRVRSGRLSPAGHGHAAPSIGTPLEHIAGALWTSVDFYGLAVPARPSVLQGNRGIRELDALNS